MIRTSIITVGLLLTATSLFAMAGSAEMTCLPAVSCVGDSGDDPYAHCDGVWADAWASDVVYAQGCTDGSTVHYNVCADSGARCDEYAYTHDPETGEPCEEGEDVCEDGEL